MVCNDEVYELGPERFIKGLSTFSPLPSNICSFFPVSPCAYHLSKQFQVLIFNFLSLLTDIQLLFVHMSHLVNEYRPHQAREQLFQILNYQVDFFDY